jgi:ABC-type bacteriocin/lantibiotic exporter with double-glycine peptidase domain
LVGGTEASARSRRAIAIAGITPWLDRTITDSTSDLSTGQRQRVGIARALMQPISLLVLDEATSGLDAAAEAELLGGLRAAFPELTVVLISHRLAPIRYCDRVFDLAALQTAHG